MAIAVILPSFNWPSKKAAFDEFRMLHTGGPYAVYDRITDPSHNLMLREVLDLHPDASEKIGKGVDYFYVGLTSDGDKFNVRSDATGVWWISATAPASATIRRNPMRRKASDSPSRTAA